MALRGFKADRMGSDRPSMLDLLKATERDHGEANETPPASGIRRRRTHAPTNTGAETAEPLGYLYCPPQAYRRLACRQAGAREDEFADD